MKTPPGLAMVMGQQQPVSVSKEAGTQMPSLGRLLHWSRDSDLGARWEMPQSLSFPSDVWQ